MPDTELIAWLASGGNVSLPPEAEAARRATAFAQRFHAALNPVDDLGPDEETHEAAVAQLVQAVHVDLNQHGEEAYSAVWSLLAAPIRRAIKHYIVLGKPCP